MTKAGQAGRGQDRPSSLGYRHEEYLDSLSEFGEPLRLRRSGGWLLAREIEAGGRDAMGPYPLMVADRWDRLCEDLRDLPKDLVSIALVTDPFAPIDAADLERCFDVVKRFKDHHVVDLSMPIESRTKAHHRRKARRALRELEVEVIERPAGHTDEWDRLYRHTIERHRIRGIRAFSKSAFATQLRVPGMVMLRARYQGHVVGATLWVHDGDVAYYHLTGTTPEGYAHDASYALVWTATEWLAQRCRWLDLGGSAGLVGDPSDGLAYFKSGWATETLPTYFCGAILDERAYRDLSGGEAAIGGYFPAYRTAESR